MSHYSGIPPPVHNIRGHSRGGPSGPSAIVFPDRFPCADRAGPRLADRQRANSRVRVPFSWFLP